MARPLPSSGVAEKCTFRRDRPATDTKANDSPPDGVLRLRRHHRIAAKIRAVLYTGATFQPVTIRDISRGGAGLENCSSLIQDDLVKISLLTGRVVEARVRWWLGGVCGVQFVEPLSNDDALLTGRMDYAVMDRSDPACENEDK
jgi:PilZ domain